MGPVLVFIVSFLLVLSFPPVKLIPSCFGKKCTTIESQENKETEATEKLFLVLDINGTLVQLSDRPTGSNKDFSVKGKFDMEFKVTYSNGVSQDIRVWKRPHVDDFLKEMAKFYHIYIFTTALKEYADKIVERFTKDCNIKFEGVKTHDDATLGKDGNTYKDVEKFNQDLNRMLILDDTPKVIAFHQNNVVPIITWNKLAKTEDKALVILAKLFEDIAKEWGKGKNTNVATKLADKLDHMNSKDKILALQY